MNEQTAVSLGCLSWVPTAKRCMPMRPALPKPVFSYHIKRSILHTLHPLRPLPSHSTIYNTIISISQDILLLGKVLQLSRRF